MTDRFGWILLEEVVADALADGLLEVRTAIADDTIDALLTRVFWSLTSTKRDRLKAWLTAHDVPVIDNYPQEQQALPCYALVLQPEQQQQFVGDQSHLTTFPDGSQRVLVAEQWRSTIAVLTVAEHPELVKWLYHLAKWILASRRDTIFRAADLHFTTLLAGQDLGFDPRYLQAGRFVYHRVLTVTAEYPQFDTQRDAAVDVVDVDLAQVAAYSGLAQQVANG